MSRAGDLAVEAAFLDDAAIAALLDERQRRYADALAVAEERSASHLLWTVGAERYATPLADLGEVAAIGRVTRVPGAPPTLAGVVNHRGQLFNLLDPAPALGAAATEAGAMMLVLRQAAPRVALRVSTVVGTVALPPEDDAADPVLARFIPLEEGDGFAIVSTALLMEKLLDRRTR